MSDLEDSPENQDIKEQEEENEDSSDSDEDDQDDAAQIEEGLRQIKFKLLDNPFDYNTHLELISFARNHGELQEVREARQKMSKTFPLTPVLWLEWISDEKALLSSDDQEGKTFIVDIFERAVKDYASVDIWLEYAQYSMADMGTKEGVDRVRDIVNRGLVQVGLDASKGSLLWDFLREFEKILLSIASNEEEKKTQVSKHFDAFKRQLSVPLIGMQSTMKEFEEWINEVDGLVNQEDVSQVKLVYEKTLKTLEMMTPFEDALLSSDTPHTQVYKDYTAFLEKHSTPSAVQSVFERGITENPLDPDLWIQYLNYLDNKLKIKDLSLEVYERSVRNCPWSGSLWSNFIESMEKYSCPLSDIIAVFERSLSAGLASGPDFKQVWTTFLDCQRRYTNFSSEKEVERLRKTFNSASEYLAAIPDADPSFSVLQYFARVEAVYCKSISNAREIWNNMMQIKELSCQASLWLEYFHLEYGHGDRKEAQKILMKAFTPSLDWPESIGELLMRMEREEGDSLEMYQKTRTKYLQVMAKVAEKREKLESQDNQMKDPVKGSVSKSPAKSSDSRKRKLDKSNDSGQETVFKKPHLPSTRSEDKEKKERSDPSSSGANASQELPHFVKPKDKTDADDLLTVFVSNLDFKVTEDKLREVFSDFGNITDIRLVRNYKGLSKGFGYIQYSSIEGVHRALSHDRMKIDGRPAFVSEVGKKKEFQFKDSLEKNKLFVNQLAHDVDERVLRETFEKYGQLKDVRIVTYRNGHSKGCAYIEYDDEVSARSGLAADGLLVKGKNIRVAISDPKRKKDNTSQPQSSLGSAASGPGTSSRGAAGRQRISVPMIPSTVMRRQIASKPFNSSNGTH